MANTKNEVAKFQPTRLPWHKAIGERFGVDQARWRVLCEAIYPGAKSGESIIMAIAYCKERKLDILKRPIHIVPVYSIEKGGYVETLWPGISELRVTAMRTGQFGGLEHTAWGDDVTETFKGKESYYENKKKKWRTVEVELTYPEWCRIDCYRILSTGERHLWPGPTVYWKETYATAGGKDSTLPNSMWQQRPRGQLEKCSEASTLRRAFPEELGSEYTAEEMEGQMWSGSGPIIDNDPQEAAPVREKPAPRQTIEETVSPFDLGANARANDIADSACPEHLNAQEYKDWMRGWKEKDAELTEASNEKDAKPDKPVQEDMLGGDDATEADLNAADVMADPSLDMVQALWKHAMENVKDYSDVDKVLNWCDKWVSENK